MDISKIDKNLAVNTTIDKTDITWMDSSLSPFKVYGAVTCNPYTRMPLDIAKNINDGIYWLSKNTAGIRIKFRTNSPYIAIHCERNNGFKMPHMTDACQSGFDLYRITENNEQHFISMFMPPVDCGKGYDSVVNLSGIMTDYVINFPLYNDVDLLYIGVKEGSDFEEPCGYANEKPVVFYGSSITQGGCASRPGNCYQNFLSRKLNMDYINLGFSGSGKAEDIMIDYLASLDMSVFVSDYDYNAPNADHLRNTHYKMYKKIREKHPNIPYIILTKPDYHYYNSEDERRSVIIETYTKALAEGDKNVYFVDGSMLFADDEWQACTVDGCHPNDLGFYRFAKTLYPTLKIALKY